MPHPRTFLHCSPRTAALVLAAIFLLFLTIGCAAALRKTGLDQAEADRIAAAAHERLSHAAAQAVENIKEGLDQGHDLKTIAVKTSSAFAWQLATIGASTIGAVLSGLLAKWLGTERKISAALITGIEKNPSNSVKDSVNEASIRAGIQPQLHRRVQALT